MQQQPFGRDSPQINRSRLFEARPLRIPCGQVNSQAAKILQHFTLIRRSVADSSPHMFQDLGFFGPISHLLSRPREKAVTGAAFLRHSGYLRARTCRRESDTLNEPEQ
jgi:hypothetical protein